MTTIGKPTSPSSKDRMVSAELPQCLQEFEVRASRWSPFLPVFTTGLTGTPRVLQSEVQAPPGTSGCCEARSSLKQGPPGSWARPWQSGFSGVQGPRLTAKRDGGLRAGLAAGCGRRVPEGWVWRPALTQAAAAAAPQPGAPRTPRPPGTWSYGIEV